MPFGIGKKDEAPDHHAQMLDKDEQEEISKIANKLEPGEKVVLVARQSRMKPGGSKMSPDTIFVTDRHLIIRNPSMMGMRENVWVIDYDKISSIDIEKGLFSSTLKVFASGYKGDIDAIDKDKAEAILQYIHNAMNKAKTTAANPGSGQLSVADELAKLAKLKEQGILSEAEFLQMKQELLKKL